MNDDDVARTPGDRDFLPLRQGHAVTPLTVLRRLWKSRRGRIIFYALLTGLLCGSTNLLLPFEDMLYMTRAAIRQHPAPQDIVVVGIDDATLAKIGADDVSRSDDAKVIDTLFRAGARRVFFDRKFQFAVDPEGDARLANVLKEHRGRVFFGAAPGEATTIFDPLAILPAPIFRQNVNIVSINGLAHPFGTTMSLPLRSQTAAGTVSSMSAQLAQLTSDKDRQLVRYPLTDIPDGYFRPDYTNDFRTIPTVSYANVLHGTVRPSVFEGKDVVVAGTAKVFHDDQELFLHGRVPGVFIHVIGGLTLQNGIPLNLGWLPAFLLVSIVVISGVGRGKSFDRYRIAGLFAVLGLGPLMADFYHINLDVMPAVATAVVAVFRALTLDKVERASEFNLSSGLPGLQLLRTSKDHVPGSLIAIKVRNYGAIIGSFEGSVEMELARQISRLIRVGDADATVFHEGDKFLWSSRMENPVDLFEHLEGLHRLVQNGLVIEGREIDLSFNCGVEVETAIPMARRVANVLQAVEQAVRDDELVCLFDPASEEVQWEISLLSALDRAIDRREVWVAYQPKFDLKAGKIVGAEALARWTHPERGPISPDKFICIAEEYHRIEKITRFVLNDAVRTAYRMRMLQADFVISVNISAQLLRFPGLPAMIFDALDQHGMGPDCLILEITETDRLDRSSKTFEMMEKLVESGLTLSIDDFGTGNATIDYLRFLPASEVKIDKVFVSELATSEKDLLLVQSIIEMAHTLGRHVVAEGVETKEINDILAGLGCDLVQGYFISRPVPFEALVEIIGETKVRKSG